MLKVVGIKLNSNNKIHTFLDNNLNLKKGERVVVETSRGREIGEVYKPVYEIEYSNSLFKVLKRADDNDVQNFNKMISEKQRIKELTKELVKKFNLDLKIVEVDLLSDFSKVTISFVSSERVDFRELVKNLAGHLKARIELKQIGARDQAKIIGGIGSCGKECCCKQYLSDFDKVSIKMAKTQNLSLNPTKISGICGRLMCCLAYENDVYTEINEKMPKINSKVLTPLGEGVVMYINLLKELVTVKFTTDNDVKINEFKLEELTFSRKDTTLNSIENKNNQNKNTFTENTSLNKTQNATNEKNISAKQHSKKKRYKNVKKSGEKIEQ